jgi:hypothetical protein
MNMNKVTADIKIILLSKVGEEEATELLEQIIQKISTIKLVRSAPKRKKDKNSPKNPQNAYMFFCNSNRASVKKDNPEMDAKNIIKTIAGRWRTLSDEDKKPYAEMAEKDKIRYKGEMSDYAKNSESSSSSDEKSNRSKPKKTLPEKKSIGGASPRSRSKVSKKSETPVRGSEEEGADNRPGIPAPKGVVSKAVVPSKSAPKKSSGGKAKAVPSKKEVPSPVPDTNRLELAGKGAGIASRLRLEGTSSPRSLSRSSAPSIAKMPEEDESDEELSDD